MRNAWQPLWDFLAVVALMALTLYAGYTNGYAAGITAQPSGTVSVTTPPAPAILSHLHRTGG
jgi:hypothetical protein